MKVLGIETSCDDTAVGLFDSEQQTVVHAIKSQLSIHEQYGGVVPELASRDHVQQLLPLVQHVLAQSDCRYNQIDGVSYTAGPGLVGALLVGATFAKSLAFALNVPSIGVNHLESHILAVMLERSVPTYPFVALLVSGGHTLLVHVKAFGQYDVLGETLDDAAGECFDKTAKLIGLGYPGGPAIAKLAKEGKKGQFIFPTPMTNKDNLHFSFSGLKTHVRRIWDDLEGTEQNKADVAQALEYAITQILYQKCEKALMQTQLKTLVVVGGVAANLSLRQSLQNLVEKLAGKLYFPRQEYCSDNGAMVAYAGFCHLATGHLDNTLAINVYSRWPLSKD